MTPRQIEVLKAMRAGVWHKVKGLGAVGKSHHSDTLQQLVRRGYVEKLETHGGVTRRTYIYAITEEGINALQVENKA